ncbi:glycosyltransferase [Cesiribacter sp. SM1]|uniref:glycosyltransferase n=1 Tax=Cesiribacter sp. SM1 TaxID=2861196 RepID=UPI001CD51D8B|nr:glycosyltransferase [Cesiribacter sp. SM1]
MIESNKPTPPLASVIITCYNHGRYLANAIESVLQQSYPAVEVVVVDDGSKDNTRAVAESYPQVVYVYQQNQGLSAARNTGVQHCKGEYVVFLDADDWLYPNALELNYNYLQQHPKAAFASTAHNKVYEKENIIREDYTEVLSNHYYVMLHGNYIGMHATVMYRSWVFKEFLYDTSLRACEDYDFYLRVARKYPIIHHSANTAAYRQHSTNMSGNDPLMLSTVLEVLEKQKKDLQTLEEHQAYKRGIRIYKKYYCGELYDKLIRRSIKPTPAAIQMLAVHQPKMLVSYVLTGNNSLTKKFIKKNIAPFALKGLKKAGLSTFALRSLHKAGLHKYFKPGIGKVDAGDLARLTPLDVSFGYERGGPIDRYYIENFMERESASIRGRVLDIGDNAYTLQYGGSKVTKSDILHVEEGNPDATFIGDLSNAPHIPDNLFDCIVLAQTLHLIYDFEGAVKTCYRLLKPGGTLLLTVPGITPIDHGEWKKTWLWSFTELAMRKMFEKCFPSRQVEFHTYGNVWVATAFIQGMGLPEVKKEQLDYEDPHYPVIITVKATKPNLG